MKFVLPVLFILGLTACADRSSGQQPQPQAVVSSESPPATSGNSEIESEAFFEQFLYRLTGHCGERAVIYRFADSSAVKSGVNKFGHDVLASIALIMLSTHRYVAFYQETDVLKYTREGFQYKTSREFVVRGIWNVIGANLELSNLGAASGGQDQGHPLMVLSPSVDIIGGGFKGRTIVLQNVDADYLPVQELNPCN
jgi:hypothetical protein